MKKFIAGIITVVLSLTAILGLSACKGGMETTTMKNWGDVISVGGAIAETENYLYYVNGLGSSANDNTFGKAVKGALLAVDKSTLASDEIKTEIVVPKLMVASDYNAGVYIFGEGEETYVYYATPSTEKDSSGNVAKSTLSFMRTKLDGTNTETFFSVKGLGTNYRIAEKDGVVYIVYYDEEAKALKTYNTQEKSVSVIAEINAKTTTATLLESGKTVYLSLSTYKLVDNGYGVQAFFTMTAYAENYFAEKEEDKGEDYVRAEESFNVLYSYSVGDQKGENGVCGKMIKNGEEGDIIYTPKLVEDGYFFYSEQNIVGKTNTFALNVSDLTVAPTLIKNADYVAENIVIENLNEIYYHDGEKGAVYKTSLTTDDAKIRQTVITGEGVSSLLYVYEGYLYYHASSGKLARHALEGDAKEENVSKDTVSSTWYEPQIFTVNNIDYIFYLDTSIEDVSYVNFVSIDGEAVLNQGEKADDESDDFYELQGQKLLGIMELKDACSKAIKAINEIPATNVEYEVVENKVVFTSAVKARAEYDALSEESKKFVSEETLNKLLNAEKAQVLANYYYDLRDYKNYAKMSEAEKNIFKQAYEDAKAYRQGLINEKDSIYTTLTYLIKENIKEMYQEADELFRS